VDLPTTNKKLAPYVPRIKSNVSNLFSLISAALFFEGCMLMIDYLLETTSQPDGRATFPWILRLIAAAFTTLQPMTSLMKYKDFKNIDDSANELYWTNYFGVLFYFVANLSSLPFLVQSATRQSASALGKNSLLWAVLFFVVAFALLLSSDSKVTMETGIGFTKSKVYTLVGVSILVMGTTCFFLFE